MTLHNILHDISEQSEAETSNLWHRIAHQIEEENLMRKSKNRRLRLSVTWTMALLGILVMSSAIFGRSQRQLYHPVTIEDIERMASPLNLVETNNDMTIQLDWGYADATQIVIAYTLFDAEGEPILGRDLAKEGQAELKHLYHPEPEQRTIYPFFRQSMIQNPNSTQQVIRFSITGTYFTNLDEFLERDFDISERGTMDIQLRFFYNTSNIQYISSHTFEFELPFGLSDFEQHNNLVEIFEDWSTSEPINNIEIYFNDLVIADSGTHLFMCVRFPADVESTLYFPNEINLYVDNHLVETVAIPYQEYAEWTNINESRIRFETNYYSLSDSPEGYCVQFMWHLAFDDLPQTMRVEIPEFYKRIDYNPDNPILQTYLALYAEEGYQLEFDYDEEFDYFYIVYPQELEKLSLGEYYDIANPIEDTLNDLYPLDERFSVGWEYEFEISPEAE